MGEYQEVCDHCGRTIELAQADGIDYLLARALRNLGIIHLRQGKYAEAKEYFEKDLAICRKLGDLQGQARANGNLGLVHDYQGDSRQSIVCQQDKLEVCIKIGDKQGVAYANMSLGTVYFKLNQLAQARELFQESLELSQKLGDIRNISLACGNLSSFYLETGDYQRALKYSQQQLLGAEETKDKYNQLFALGSLGVIYKGLKQEAKAEECFDKAISLCRETGQRHDLAMNLFDKAKLCHSQQRFEEAFELNRESLDIAEGISAQNVLFPAKMLKAKLAARNDVNEGLNQLKKALMESQDYEEMAPLNLELFKLTGEQAYKKTALSLFNLLNSKSARMEYREALEYLNRNENLDVPFQ
jgi:tetratricopeptide (TPR) repeat protein